MPNFDEQIESSADKISLRLSDIENEFFLLAAKRLSKIYGMSNERLNEYLYSAEYLDDVNSDLNKVKKLLKKTYKDNVKDMKSLSREIADKTSGEADRLTGVKRG